MRLYAVPFAGNIGSSKVLEKCGFELEGVLKKCVYKFGEYKDCFLYAKLKDNN